MISKIFIAVIIFESATAVAYTSATTKPPKILRGRPVQYRNDTKTMGTLRSGLISDIFTLTTSALFNQSASSTNSSERNASSCEPPENMEEEFGAAESTFLALTLGLLIMVMIVGNILVITAIVMERELQRAQYYLVLSLAVADLMVGVLVSPLAATYNIHRKWKLGVPVCDFWVISDVLACTSSILHLVAIALDRYWSITDITYMQKRTPRRIGVMILIVWIISFAVSVAPMLGWKDAQFECRVKVRKECLISQDVSYQIFSTTTAFYGPLVFICILYWQIYKAAKRRIQMQEKRRSNTTVAQLRAKILALQQQNPAGESPNDDKLQRRRSGRNDTDDEDDSVDMDNGHGPPLTNGRLSYQQQQVQIRLIQPSSNEPTAVGVDPESAVVPTVNVSHLKIRDNAISRVAPAAVSPVSSCYSFNEAMVDSSPDDAPACNANFRGYGQKVYDNEENTSSVTSAASILNRCNGAPPSTNLSAVTPPAPAKRLSKTGTSSDDELGCESPTPSPLIVPPCRSRRRSSSSAGRTRKATGAYSTTSAVINSAQQRGARISNFSQSELTSTTFSCAGQAAAAAAAAAAAGQAAKRGRFRSKKESAESSRERRAGRTLAIITGIFVVCWVPFFVLALIRPLCGEPCTGTEPLDSVFLWLGYVNSAINPIIYTIFSPDFRQAFKRTLQRFCLFKKV